MSHWQTGKIGLSCSLAVLRRALLNIMPHWEDHIQSDPNGKIDLYDYLGNLSKRDYQMMVPGRGHPGVEGAPDIVYNDLGFKQNEDGSWEYIIDSAGMRDPNLIGSLKQEVARMRVLAIARKRGCPILKDEMQGDERAVRWVKNTEQRFLTA